MELREQFGFLLENGRFSSMAEKSGPGYAEIYFRSARVDLRIMEQQEVGAPNTILCFLVDPSNPRRWCMFETAVGKMCGEHVTGGNGRAQLAGHIRAFIDSILEKAKRGTGIPFDDFTNPATAAP